MASVRVDVKPEHVAAGAKPTDPTDPNFHETYNRLWAAPVERALSDLTGGQEVDVDGDGAAAVPGAAHPRVGAPRPGAPPAAEGHRMTAYWYPWRWRLVSIVALIALEWLGPCLIYGTTPL